jgi:crotonobetainyl-CoA:carnitine CoA-transferase CaiB-like acyl-CoA transferase
VEPDSSRSSLDKVINVEAQLQEAAKMMGGPSKEEVTQVLERVGLAASNLRRVSQAIDRQSLARRSAITPMEHSVRKARAIRFRQPDVA